MEGEYVSRLRFDRVVAELRCSGGSEYRGWRNASDETVGPNVGCVKSSFDLFTELPVFLFVTCFSKCVSHLAHESRVICPVCRGNQIHGRHALRCKPVREWNAIVFLPQIICVRPLNCREILLHPFPILFDNLFVPGLNPGRPWDDDASVAPSRAITGIRARRSRRENSIHISSNLRSTQVCSEFSRERCQIHVVGGRAPENLRIGRPPQALIALRAVGRYSDEVRTLAPQNIAPQLVDHAVAGLERRGEWSIGVKHNRLHLVDLWLTPQSRNLDISKPVEGERRPIFFAAFSCKDEMVGGLCGAQVLHIKRTVRI